MRTTVETGEYARVFISKCNVYMPGREPLEEISGVCIETHSGRECGGDKNFTHECVKVTQAVLVCCPAFSRAKRGIFQSWIESLNGERSMIATKEFLLPKGEGQDEGKVRINNQTNPIFDHISREDI